ncbi:MAG: right-handed parallel beta-helix repeat-containing protein [Bdellovibrionia bacterium]
MIIFPLKIALLAAFAVAAPAVDECQFIRDEIQRLPAAGGEVAIPEGTYTCMSPIVLDRSHAHLTGKGDVLLRLGRNVNAPVLVMGDAATPPRSLEDVRVSNLKIDGNRWYQKFECWGGACDSGGTAFIRNNGITVRGLTRGKIQNVAVTSARSGGVVTEKGVYDLVIEGLLATDNEFDGFAGYETFGARLTGLNLSRNRAAGISIDIRFHGNHFKDVRIENNGDVGIFMRDSNMNVFENVSILNSGSHGVFLAQDFGPSTCSVGNEFENLTVVHSRGSGFRLNDACEGNHLTGLARFLQNRDGCVTEAEGARLEVKGQIQCEQ